MVRQRSFDRRTVIQTLVSLLAISVGAQSATATDGRATAARSSVGQDGDSENDTDETSSVRGFYGATVDRIVDGEHVVVLIETTGEVVEQFVVPRDEYPTVEEGTRLVVWVDDSGMTVLWRW